MSVGQEKKLLGTCICLNSAQQIEIVTFVDTVTLKSRYKRGRFKFKFSLLDIDEWDVNETHVRDRPQLTDERQNRLRQAIERLGRRLVE